MHKYVRIPAGKKCSFFGKFGVFCFLEKPGLRFVLLPYYRRHLKSLTKPGILHFTLFILFPVTALKHIWAFKHSGGKWMASDTNEMLNWVFCTCFNRSKLTKPICSQCFIPVTPENIWKLYKVFWCFQRLWKCNIVCKWDKVTVEIKCFFSAYLAQLTRPLVHNL